MAPKKKELHQSAALTGARVGSDAAVSEGLRALVNGLFGKKKPYRPSPQEIADYYLTLREREVAYLAALGFSDQEIGEALGMTFQAVRVHLHRVLVKMQVADARELREYFGPGSRS